MINKVLALEINATTLPVGGNITNIGQVVGFFTSMAMVVGALGLLVMMLMAGYQYITYAGDPKKLSAATARFWWAIMGLILIVSAYLFTRVIGTITGVKIQL